MQEASQYMISNYTSETQFSKKQHGTGIKTNTTDQGNKIEGPEINPQSHTV
jgi:hypothetical protein